MENEIIIGMEAFIKKSKQNLFAIYFEDNFPGYSTGFAYFNNDTNYTWLDKSNCCISTYTEQYGFDSQGYGEAITIAELEDNTDITKIRLVQENMKLFKAIPVRLFSKTEALNYLEEMKTDVEVIKHNEYFLHFFDSVEETEFIPLHNNQYHEFL